MKSENPHGQGEGIADNGTVPEPTTPEQERKARIVAAIRDYLAHGHSTFRARQIQVEGAALRKGRKGSGQ